MAAGPTLDGLAADLAAGRTSARALTEACLARIDDPAGQGAVVFIQVDREGALAAADAMDGLRAAGAQPSRFAGIPISIKDLFDVQGQATRAGSVVLDGPPAAQDAPAVARLRQAGFVLIGRTNMTEFAFSGLGYNPHYGTPLGPWGREEGRIAGGSTSGGAASVADAMAHAALGTDTGGSCRIPAAFCGLVGYKPTASRTPRSGAVPLSTTLDSVGPIARSVGCCASIDGLLARSQAPALDGAAASDLRLLAPQNVVLEGMDSVVADTLEDALSRLSAAGARISRIPFPEFDRIAALNARGGFAAPEAYAWHRRLIEAAADRYDPRVLTRIRRGAEQSAADFVDLIADRTALVADARRRLTGFDALVMPTAPMVAPRLSDLEDDAEFGRINLLALRNSTAINVIDGCAISVPAHRPGAAPVGLMLAAAGGQDERLFQIAAAVERVLAGG